MGQDMTISWLGKLLTILVIATSLHGEEIIESIEGVPVRLFADIHRIQEGKSVLAFCDKNLDCAEDTSHAFRVFDVFSAMKNYDIAPILKIARAYRTNKRFKETPEFFAGVLLSLAKQPMEGEKLLKLGYNKSQSKYRQERQKLGQKSKNSKDYFFALSELTQQTVLICISEIINSQTDSCAPRVDDIVKKYSECLKIGDDAYLDKVVFKYALLSNNLDLTKKIFGLIQGHRANMVFFSSKEMAIVFFEWINAHNAWLTDTALRDYLQLEKHQIISVTADCKRIEEILDHNNKVQCVK